MRIAPLLLAALVALSTGCQALTLLGGDPGTNGTLRVQVEVGSLEAAVRGNASLEDHEPGPRLASIPVQTEAWRGFPNVTVLEPTGEGWLILADGRSGLLVPVDARRPRAPDRPASSAEAAEPNGSSPGSGGVNSSDAQRGSQPPGQANASGTEDAPARLQAPHKEQPERTQTTLDPRQAVVETERATPRGGDDVLPVDPTVVVLSLLFVGAFAVERFQSSQEETSRLREGRDREP